MAANVAAPQGFLSTRLLGSSAPNFATRQEVIAYNYTTRINSGDPVYRYTDGTIRLVAISGTTIHGIFRGCHYLDPSTGRTEYRRYWPGVAVASTTTVFADVESDPQMVFQAQFIGTALTVSAIGFNTDITTGTSGTATANGGSACSLGATPANTATFPFRILGIVGLQGTTPSPAISASYNPLNDNQWLEVMMNTQDYPAGTRTGQA